MIQSWYCYAKTEVEEQALNFTERTGLDVVSICRTLVLGPILQSTTNASSMFLINLLKGCDTLENEHCQINRIVDVRDVADAILLAYENHEAERRYICTSHAIKDRDFFPVQLYCCL
ncbi:NAD(P)-binding Rossmann-fold superfamily protein [Trifolium repens]|nr:NAD(P)-binding Rossmann-fold superfamily protein [Trifolium repens]